MDIELYLPEMLLAANDEVFLCYSKGCLIVRDKEEKRIIKKKRIYSLLKSFFLIERLLRLTPRASIALDDDEFLFSRHGFIYNYNIKTNSINIEHSFTKGMNNPLSFCVRRNSDSKIVDIVYGEYIQKNMKKTIAIYKRGNGTWKKKYEFSKNDVLHIHNIVYDKYKNRYLILTGDADNESAIWESDIDFRNVKKIVGGAQIYRACVAYPTKDGIYYATDTPLEDNWFCYLDNNNKLTKLFKMPGPCIYGKIFNDELYMATSVEGDPRLVGWKYLLSTKPGKGVQDKYSHIIRYDSNGNVQEITKFKKDWLPLALFQFGNALFSCTPEELFVCPQSCKERGTYRIYDGHKSK